MRVVENETLKPLRDRGGSVFADLTFRRCEFVSSSISITTDPASRSAVRNVVLEDCSVRTSDLHQAWGAVFKHVVVRGRIGRLMCSPLISSMAGETPEQRAFDEANAAYYEGVDWALDISQAEANEIAISGVPARLVRRDPETQVVLTRETALAGEWRSLDHVTACWFETAIEGMLLDGEPDVVLAAGRRDREFRKLMAAIEQLRAAGITEPD